MEVARLPAGVPLMIGDVVHNLRSALDLMMYEMVALTGTPPSDNLYFPFRSTAKRLEEAVRDPEVQRLGPSVINLIVNEIKPYPESAGGNGRLYALHQLDIMDKHKLLIPAITMVWAKGLDAEADNGSRLTNLRLTAWQGARLSAITVPGRVRITNPGQASGAIAFREPKFFTGDSVVPTLHILSRLVESVVTAIEGPYFASGVATLADSPTEP